MHWLGDRLGRLDQVTHRRWFVFQVRCSQALTYVSLAQLGLGPLIAYLGHWGVHGHVMLGSLALFYWSMMLSQHPGFTRVMPSPLSSVATCLLAASASFLMALGLWPWRIGLLLAATHYLALLSIGGLGKAPLYRPNWFTLIGLAYALVASVTGNEWGLLGFSLAMVTHLMRRVEGRQVVGVHEVPMAALALAPLVIDQVPMATVPALLLALLWKPRTLPRQGFASAYPVGAILGRASLVIALFLALTNYPRDTILHALAVGFVSVIMFSLCIPILVPGIAWVSLWRYGKEIPLLAFSSAISRILLVHLGQPALLASLALLYSATVDAALAYLLGKRVKVL